MDVPLSPPRCLDRAADLFSKKTGVICGDTTLTYGEFAERCFRLAGGLVREGAGKGDRVAFLSYNIHRLLEGYYGVAQAHAVAMPINVRLSPPENAESRGKLIRVSGGEFRSAWPGGTRPRCLACTTS